MKIFVRALVAVVLVVVLAVVGLLAWSSMVLQGDRAAAIDVWSNPAISITSTDHSIVMTPTREASGDGLVFIPGAKVDPYAYMNTLSGSVEQGLTVVITKPTLNLAFFDQRPLSTFTGDAPQVDKWFVGGHSLGGVRACQLADSADVAGLILFGSYCANDKSGSQLAVLSIAGSKDLLSTQAKIDDAAPLLPSSAEFVIIQGLNHAGFGDYGIQPGDGVATIGRDDARSQITAAIEGFLAR